MGEARFKTLITRPVVVLVIGVLGLSFGLAVAYSPSFFGLPYLLLTSLVAFGAGAFVLQSVSGLSARGWGFLLPCVICFLVPLFHLRTYLFPSASFSHLITNDFDRLYYVYKVYLLSSLSEGRIPLWSPSEACGFPFYANPFTQAYYPLNIALAVWNGIRGGYSQLDHQVFTVLAVSLFSVGLFLWLRCLQFSVRSSMLAACVMGVSFKVTELVRFPNAIHTAAWIPYILLGMTLCSSSAKRTMGTALVASSGTLMLTGGYPYFVYYCIFLVGLYAPIVLLPEFREALGLPPERAARRGLGAMAVGWAIPIGVCLPYFVKMRWLLNQTVDRGGHSYSYSTEHVFSFTDTVGSLVFPPAAQVEGWYYLSAVGLIMVAIPFANAVVPVSGTRTNRLWLLVLTAAFLFVTALSYGAGSLMFKLFWHCLPGFSSLRVWGRVNILLVPVLALLLARGYTLFEEAWVGCDRNGLPASSRNKRLLGITVVVGVSMVVLQVVLLRNQVFDRYWVAWFHPHIPEGLGPETFVFASVGSVVGLGLLPVLGLWASERVARHRALAAWCAVGVVLGLALWDLDGIGNTQWSKRTRFTVVKTRLAVRETDLQALRCAREPFDQLSLGPVFGTGVMTNWYYQRYADFLGRSKDSPAARYLVGQAGGERFFFVESVAHKDAEGVVADVAAQVTGSQFELTVRDYDGDRLVLHVNMGRQGHLCFIDNWDEDWCVAVDGGKAQLEVLLGCFKAVALSPGRHEVEFEYRPSLWGRAVLRSQ
ncbi:MAG: hypothetical protein A3K19_25980 [Lentisphaerae bacterium RIFOXYB12_FULL_65_16]|nr:MAG: hypothetical protein A3K18_08780 [Lentisphaerae bacterium RIFOXYA12_64_32]OGV87717.1 MAG: hypothetical protein A3K19_25980 [Lentisphaerae bacterium RIFOXYB12_FULL_65_16]